jgi:hypothetical protein
MFRLLGGSFRACKTKSLIPAMTFNQGHSRGTLVQPLGTRLVVALQGTPNGTFFVSRNSLMTMRVPSPNSW